MKCPACGKRMAPAKSAGDWGDFVFWVDSGVMLGVVLALLVAPFSLLLAIAIGVAVVVIYALLSLPGRGGRRSCKSCGNGHEQGKST